MLHPSSFLSFLLLSFLVISVSASRVAVYVQTFHDQNGNPLTLTPLLDNGSGVTHVILSSIHLGATAGSIALNDNNFGDAYYDQIWKDVKTLQAAGVKVMAMIGGAGDQSFNRLNSNVSIHPKILV